MIRTIVREQRLPSFSIDTDDLKELLTRLSKLFDTSERIYIYVSFHLPDERLRYDNIEDIGKMHGSRCIKSFNVEMSQKNNRIEIRSSFPLPGRPLVRVSSESQAWCEYAIKTTHSFIKPHATWHETVLSIPRWIYAAILIAPYLIVFTLPKEQILLYRTTILIWLGAGSAFFSILAFGGRVFPLGVIRPSGGREPSRTT